MKDTTEVERGMSCNSAAMHYAHSFILFSLKKKKKIIPDARVGREFFHSFPPPLPTACPTLLFVHEALGKAGVGHTQQTDLYDGTV